MEKVSVIITTCRREPAIVKEAIDSVINQSYPNVEVIVVNDAPDYMRRKEIDELISSYGGKIKYIVNESSKGANYSRNLGAHNSTGEVLSFLDDDDYWAPERLCKVVESIINGNSIVYSDYYIFSDQKMTYSKKIFPAPEKQLEKLLAGNFLGGFSNVSFTKKVFVDCGELDEGMPSYQDQDLFVRLIQIGKLGYINQALSYYRITPNSISLNGEKKYRGMILLLEKYSSLFERYPDSKRRRLESELVYARKQGWADNAKRISGMLKEFDSYWRIIKLSIKGRLKHVAIKLFKYQ